ncbi:hypothetical protein Caci_1304 [Catenulispora acidiphila DSM 44928]|uniref:Secreted protein n=1 Tax=Catenulispora acidiphila (strain DSM 44928 / JCM 14897 / NBRC 102108 / NRRL B-24433 / ID139908) TaxID=479433 RepID=C7Q7E1_CATAD|nr:hypothetical protein [Catenulispora acidiphila]ACU70229.1 hypothetical protein Caci_1304 [Catenulispora acidiphila DSM 44928]
MLRRRSLLALIAGVLLSFPSLAACPASASEEAGQSWVQASITAQLARKPGGVVDGDSIFYAKEDVTLTYKPATVPGSAVADDFAGCSTNEVCVYTTTDVISSGVRLSTGSLWCPWENTNNLLDLRDYGLADQIRAADSENGWWAEGIWSKLGVRGKQWKMDPHGILSNLSTTNITYLNVCIKEGDLEY